MGNYLPEVNLGSGLDPLSLKLGHLFTCTQFLNNDLKCWGDNFSGQLGIGSTQDKGDDPGEMGDYLSPISLPSGTEIQSFSLGFSHVHIIDQNGQIILWGRNSAGQLGWEAHPISDIKRMKWGITYKPPYWEWVE